VPGAQEAEDLSNTVFEKAFAAIGRYQPSPAQFSTWLYTIARNAVIDHYRRRRLPVQDGAEDDLRRSPDPAADPEALVLADERRRRLHEAIMELTDEQRQVVGCRFYFNLSIHEVAQATGKTEGAVKALQFRALERLHRKLAPEWSLS
jgi:RNA polymerase sigma-70 factor (ECF subfamily)